MILKEVNYQAQGDVPAALLIEETGQSDGTSPANGRIFGGQLGDGFFITTADRERELSPQEHAFLMMLAIGGDALAHTVTADIKVSTYEETMGLKSGIMRKLGVTSPDLMAHVGHCFRSGLFAVSLDMRLADDCIITDEQAGVLDMLSKGVGITVKAAGELCVSLNRANKIRGGLYKAFGVGSLAAAVTAGYLTGVLPRE